MYADASDFNGVFSEGGGLMEGIRSYLISVVAVCAIAAIASTMVKASLVSRVLRLVCGILVLAVVISPFAKINLNTLSDSLESLISTDTKPIEDTAKRAQEQFKLQVQKSTEQHIEQIAANFGISVQARVTVEEGELPVPSEVELIGDCPVEQKAELSDYIANQIGIPYEKQTWRQYGAND